MISHPQPTKGAAIITIFLRPSHPDKTPPIGEQITPTIQNRDANNEPS